MRLSSRRLVMREPEAGDIDWVTTELQDLEIQRNTTVPSPYARADAEQFVHNANTGQRNTFIITETGQRAGAISLHDKRASSIGYWIGKAAHRPRHRHRSRHQSLPLGLRRPRAADHHLVGERGQRSVPGGRGQGRIPDGRNPDAPHHVPRCPTGLLGGIGAAARTARHPLTDGPLGECRQCRSRRVPVA